MAIINKSINKCWWGCGEKGLLLHCWWGCKLVQSLWKTVWRFLKDFKIELPHDPTVLKTLLWKNVCNPMFTAALLGIAKICKQPGCLWIDEWTRMMWCICTHSLTHKMEYYAATKKNEILPLAITWMDLEGIKIS